MDLELGSEGIGTTIVFPSGMFPPALVELWRDDNRDAASDDLSLSPEARNVMSLVAAEMASDPTDVTTDAATAAPVIDAVIAGHRYVVTHGVSSTAAVDARCLTVRASTYSGSLGRLALDSPRWGPSRHRAGLNDGRSFS